MSNIIKSTRIRSQSIIDLSDRVLPQTEKRHAEDKKSDQSLEKVFDLETIKQRENELKELEISLQERLAETQMEVESMIAQALEKAQKIEEEAREKEAQMIEEAYHKQEEIKNEAEEAANTIKKLALEEKRMMLEATEGEVVEVIITLLKHIISQEVTGRVEWLKLVVRRLLLQEEINDTVTLLVSPHNMELLETEKKGFLESLSKLSAIEVSDLVNDTTCVLVTSQGNIEYNIAEGLEKVITELRTLRDLT